MSFISHKTKEYNQQQQMKKVAVSPYFDAKWYLQNYPDVRAAGVNPVIHYFNNGWKEGRNPSPNFNTKEYLQQHPELQVFEINPLAHFIAGKTTLVVKYDVVFSLGEVCFCANYLRSLRLRKFSSPFDWIAGAGFKERMNLLINDFHNFFNQEDLIYHGQREFPQPCDIYYNTRTQIMFNHDFPLYKPFAEQYPKIKERYDRRINKLYERLKKADKALIVYMEQADTRSGVKSDDELCSAMHELNAKFRNTHIDLIYIRHNENMKDNEYAIKRIDNYVITAQCFNRSIAENTTAIGNLQNVKNLLRCVSCRDSIWNRSIYGLARLWYSLCKIIYRHKVKHGVEYIRILGIKIIIHHHRN